jgi:uncharacterized protein YegP (UPF0339 family)
MYNFEIIENENGRFRWRLTAPNGHIMCGSTEGDGYRDPSGALEALKQTARAFGRWGDVFATWTTLDDEIVIKSEAGAPGARIRVVRREVE